MPAREFEDFVADRLRCLGREHGGSRLRGECLEFGVYVGTSMGAAVRAFDRAGVHPSRFVGFAFFEALPRGSESDG